MKRNLTLLILILFTISMSAQSRRRPINNQRENIIVDSRGNVQYNDGRGFRATLSDRLRGMRYEDNRRNEIFYSKEVWTEVADEFGQNNTEVMRWLVDRFRSMRNSKEEYSYRPNGDLEYERNRDFRATLSSGLSDEIAYKDSRGNELLYSRSVWRELYPEAESGKFFVFSWLLDEYSDKNNMKERYRHDMRGDLEYERNGFKATFTKDIFDNRIYKDSKGNEVLYSKEIWAKMHPDLKASDIEVLSFLVESFNEKENVKEKYKYNIHGNLEYENNQGLNASLSKNVFDEWLYKDNFDNEIKYSKEYWAEIIQDFKYDEIKAFFWMMDQRYGKKRFKEEYKIDVFGYQQYKNNFRQTASISKDIFDKMIYKDSKGNKIEYTPDAWSRMLQNYRTEKKLFAALIQEYLFEKQR